MKVVFTDRARDHIDERLAYSVARFGQDVTERTFRRLDAYIHGSLARHPDTAGDQQPGRDFYAAWAPGTPFFVIYRFDTTNDTVTVLAIYHHAQERSTFDPDRG